MLEDRVRSVADGVKLSGMAARRPSRSTRRSKPRSGHRAARFVFMDRAAIGLGRLFLHLAAELNFYSLLNRSSRFCGR